MQCGYCNPDGLGHGEARTRWERKRADPALKVYVALVEPEALDDRGGRLMPDSLVDEEARRTIREDTGRTLFVDAGAGSGKTSKLIDRVMRLVLEDGVPLRTIAAVTFTEKAGAELRDRLRAEFEKVEQSPETGERG